jgi:hypothetical protein
MEPDIITKIIRVLTPGLENNKKPDSAEFEDNDRNDAYDSSEDSASEDEVEAEIPKDSIEGAQNLAADTQQDRQEPTEIQPLPKKSFSELQTTKFKLLYQRAQYPPAESYRGVIISEFSEDTRLRPTVSLDEDCDNLRWKLLELEEAKNKIGLLIKIREAQLQAAETSKEAAEENFETHLEHSGISRELYQAYQAFCDSLDPEFGQRGGFSITCDADHKGLYPEYDPGFLVFKECIETSYTQCNFRCEASKEYASIRTLDKKTNQMGWQPGWNFVVEFWPIKPPEPLMGTESTWGDQYVSLLP